MRSKKSAMEQPQLQERVRVLETFRSEGAVRPDKDRRLKISLRLSMAEYEIVARYMRPGETFSEALRKLIRDSKGLHR